jgi:hypothetical protein
MGSRLIGVPLRSIRRCRSQEAPMATLLDLLSVLGIVVAGLFVWAALSPIEVLGWWAGWFGDRIHDAGVPRSSGEDTTGIEPEAYFFYISGVGKANGENHSFREQEFVRRLQTAMPGLLIIDDLFPYSVNNLPLTGQRFFAWLWRWALRRKLTGPKLAGYLINVRNIWQLLISADRRYGPIMNQALAQVMVHELLRRGYNPETRRPIFLFGYSGAGQMAVAPVMYLKEWLHAPVTIICLGGVFVSDPSLLVADHIYHVVGERDTVHPWAYLAPGRWGINVTSEWNRARRQGKVTITVLPEMCHSGRGGYMDHKRFLMDGRSYLETTLNLVTGILRKHIEQNPVEPVPGRLGADAAKGAVAVVPAAD